MKKIVHKEVSYTAMGDKWYVALCTGHPTQNQMENSWKKVTCKHCLKRR